jgi:hypothetical protein
VLKSVIYYKSIKREVKRRLIHEYRYNERLKTKSLGSYTPRTHRVGRQGRVVYYESIKRELKIRGIYEVGVVVYFLLFIMNR